MAVIQHHVEGWFHNGLGELSRYMIGGGVSYVYIQDVKWREGKHHSLCKKYPASDGIYGTPTHKTAYAGLNKCVINFCISSTFLSKWGSHTYLRSTFQTRSKTLAQKTKGSKMLQNSCKIDLALSLHLSRFDWYVRSIQDFICTQKYMPHKHCA